jgi:hypothetical protein
MIRAYFMRHGETLYFEDMMTAAEKKEVIQSGWFLDLTPKGAGNVRRSTLEIVDEILTPVYFFTSPALRARGTARVVMNTLLNNNIEVINVSDPKIVNSLRNYDQAPPTNPAKIAFPDLFIQALSKEHLNRVDSERFNGINMEGRFHSSRRALDFLKWFVEYCKAHIDEDLTLFFTGHSEVFGPFLEQLFSPPLPLESTPRLGISDEGIQRAQYLKATIFANSSGRLLIESEFRDMSLVQYLDEIDTTTHWFSDIYKDKTVKPQDR